MNPAKLFITSRTEEKCAQTAELIKNETGYDKIVSWPLELSSFASTKAFANRFEREGGQLDILVLNAAVATHNYEVTTDGHETTVQVNHLSGALLAFRLLPTLLSTAQKNKSVSRLIVVASGVHDSVTFGLDRIPNDAGLLETLSSKHYCTQETMKGLRYRESKLLNVLFARALQEHIPADASIIVTSVDPGFAISALRRTIDRGQFADLMPFARTTEEGSRQLIIAAVGPRDGGDVQRMRGAYVADNEVTDPSEWVRSGEGKVVQGKLWNETWETLVKVDASVSKASEMLVNSSL